MDVIAIALDSGHQSGDQRTSTIRVAIGKMFSRGMNHDVALAPGQVAAIQAASIRKFAELLGADPRHVTALATEPGEVEAVLSTGYALVATENCRLDRTLQRVGRVLRGEVQDPSPVSELQAAACLLDMGFQQAQEIQEGSNARTADFLCTWSGNEQVEIEVTRKRRHHGEVDLDERALNLGEQLLDCRKDQIQLPLTCYVTSFDEKVVEGITQAAVQIRGTRLSMEVAGVWSLAVGVQNPTVPPTWWPLERPLKHVRLGSTRIVEAGSAPLAWLGYGVDTKGYLRRVFKKAKKHQESGAFPFLIAHDCRELVNGVCAMRGPVARAITDPSWNHVGGVLLFRSVVCPDGGVGWIWDIVPNPRAERRLPQAILQQRPPETSWRGPRAVPSVSHIATIETTML